MKLRRVAVAAAAAVALSSTSVPAASATSRWSKSQCQAWVKQYKKKHPHLDHLSNKTISEANKLLKSYGCPERL
jgi:hypothetical protein